MKLDIGEIIRQEFEKSGLSISQFARMINKERTVVYNLFKRQSIDTHQLYQICMVLNVDLFRVFSECLGEENKVIGADRVNELQTTSSKRKVMLEVELDDMEYDRIMQKMFEKKKDLSR